MGKKMPEVTLIPRTEDSIPWEAADRQLVPTNLKRYGYVEEEYFFSGGADLFTLKEDHAELKMPDVPYTNRFLVRRPADAKQFSGNIVIELFNSTNTWDVSPMWCMVWPKLLEDGDIYVGVTVRAICARSLQQYDAKRYAPLCWKSPNPKPIDMDSQNWSPDTLLRGHLLEDGEDGLFWDMFTQLGNYFRGEKWEGIIGAPVNHIYVMGCSQSGMYVSTYVNFFHETERPSPIESPFDGYLSYSGEIMLALNQQEDAPDLHDEIQITKNCPVPFIRILSQWEFRDFTGRLYHRRPDSDEPGDRFRLYEIAGHCHNAFAGAFYRPGYAEMEQFGKKAALPPNDLPTLPLEMVVTQALRNMDLWAQGKAAPPHAPGLIEVDEDGQAVVDEYGNGVGGFRFPQVDVPTGSYLLGNGGNAQNGKFVPFSAEKLQELYPSRQDYYDKIFVAIDKLVDQRFISVPDGDRMKYDILRTPLALE